MYMCIYFNIFINVNQIMSEYKLGIHLVFLLLSFSQHGFAAVMKDKEAITVMVLSMFFGTQRYSMVYIMSVYMSLLLGQ